MLQHVRPFSILSNKNSIVNVQAVLENINAKIAEQEVNVNLFIATLVPDGTVTIREHAIDTIPNGILPHPIEDFGRRHIANIDKEEDVQPEEMEVYAKEGESFFSYAIYNSGYIFCVTSDTMALAKLLATEANNSFWKPSTADS